jgi:hypothetical protein
MSDDTKNRGPADRARVNVNESWELTYWSEKFGVSAEKLKESVKRVGPMAADVQRDLGK